MEILDAAKKVLAPAHDPGIAAPRIAHRHRRRIGRCAIYLHPVLMKDIKDLKAQLVIVTGFLFLSWLFDSDWLTNAALLLGLVFLISPKLSNAILWFWDKLAHVLGWINTRILLSLVFYVFLFPIALLFRLFTRDPLSLKWNKTSSTFTIRDHKYVSSDLENPW